MMPVDSPDPAASPEDEAFRARTLRSFFDGRRLRQIPARRRAREVILHELVTWFEAGKRYPEPEVNGILADAHDDVAYLRRELIESDLLARENSVYWVAE